VRLSGGGAAGHQPAHPAGPRTATREARQRGLREALDKGEPARRAGAPTIVPTGRSSGNEMGGAAGAQPPPASSLISSATTATPASASRPRERTSDGAANLAAGKTRLTGLHSTPPTSRSYCSVTGVLAQRELARDRPHPLFDIDDLGALQRQVRPLGGRCLHPARRRAWLAPALPAAAGISSAAGRAETFAVLTQGQLSPPF